MKTRKHKHMSMQGLLRQIIEDQDKVQEERGKAAARSIAPQNLPEELRPRERLMRDGPAALCDRELLAIILNTGVKGKNVSVLADELRERLDADKNIPSVKELSSLSGIGASKASAIVAMLELGRRRWGCRGTRVRGADDVYPLLRHYADCNQERFICVSMNGAYEVIAIRVVTIGLVNKSLVHPREVFADVIADRASAVCVAHNHPSGIIKPSDQDDEVTGRLSNAAQLLGINFLDHIIFTGKDYYSYRSAGRI
jgi:DNA repair protein RadC